MLPWGAWGAGRWLGVCPQEGGWSRQRGGRWKSAEGGGLAGYRAGVRGAVEEPWGRANRSIPTPGDPGRHFSEQGFAWNSDAHVVQNSRLAPASGAPRKSHLLGCSPPWGSCSAAAARPCRRRGTAGTAAQGNGSLTERHRRETISPGNISSNSWRELIWARLSQELWGNDCGSRACLPLVGWCPGHPTERPPRCLGRGQHQWAHSLW